MIQINIGSNKNQFGSIRSKNVSENVEQVYNEFLHLLIKYVEANPNVTKESILSILNVLETEIQSLKSQQLLNDLFIRLERNINSSLEAITLPITNNDTQSFMKPDIFFIKQKKTYQLA